MGRRILSFGVSATHARITALTNFEDDVCLSDYEAMVLDPSALLSMRISAAAFFRRQKELGDLIQRKGGLSIWFMRPPLQVNLVGGGWQDVMTILSGANMRAAGMVQETLRVGRTT